ncbi:MULTISPECIES: hypothetical protein [Actinomadura]|uniref:Uncharacterized protein n=1 Tax=Actinomadura madurae TaxID=1993 RepID=A0A1I5CKY2_9ACTN|nr:hypothetical protein [Actinomadura madurae]SFN87554.1 hypothetical protein SAMN04489713_103291 [Actinomadura madurae]SPT50670.1 Uncharacterised protein [Actinomadura madurae]
MALHIGRKRSETTQETPRRRLWPRRPATDETGRPVVVERKPRRWRRSRQNPVSAMILAAGWAAAAILALGMLLTWGDANPANVLVDATLDAGRWLATPFHDVFTRSDPREQLYINWTLAGVVYYVIARALSWMTRF